MVTWPHRAVWLVHSKVLRRGQLLTVTGLSGELHQICRKMTDLNRTYEAAVQTLHVDLVSDPSVVKQRNDAGKKAMMLTFLERLELCPDLPGMDIVHVSGTKGKGSTCAFTESILRHNGYTTGMFTSPHMSEARERVRINGRPVTRDMFAQYFWEVYTKLKETATTDALNEIGGMPAYFNFTVILALYTFVKEKINAAVFEVGIGGEYDSTNFFTHPAACGVASLGYDHLSVLGDTLDKIAWHKAGIFKRGCPAITTTQDIPPPRPSFHRMEQTTSSGHHVESVERSAGDKHPMQVLLERAVERQCPLYIAPPFSLDADSTKSPLGIAGSKQPRNAALAVQLAQMVINKGKSASLPPMQAGSEVKDIPLLTTDVHELDQPTLEGLRSCYWPGRTEVVKHDGITYYLDGAHTEESIEHCAEWFKKVADEEKAEEERKGGKVVRLLVFNLTKNRNPGNLLRYLVDCGFDEAVFTPHLMSTNPSETFIDHFDKHLTTEVKKTVPLENRATWDYLIGKGDSQPSLTFPSILQALTWVTQGRDPYIMKVRDPLTVATEKEAMPEVPAAYGAATHIQILVTGSLLLVGPVLGILRPGMND